MEKDMKIIYLGVTCILSVICWIATQLSWQYANILFYIALFFTSWYIDLFFLYQEEHESSKKYTIITPSNLVYLVIITIILFILRKYNIKEYATVKYAFYKLVVIVNAIQAAIIVIYYKLREIFTNI
jgi:membrane-associated phospholipid phosphatase